MSSALESQERISRYLNNLYAWAKTATGTGPAIQLEDIFRNFFNALFSWELTNANDIQSQFPAFDLVDEKGHFVQITINGSSQKIRETIAKAETHSDTIAAMGGGHDVSAGQGQGIIFFCLPEAPKSPKGIPANYEVWSIKDLMEMIRQTFLVPANVSAAPLHEAARCLEQELLKYNIILAPPSRAKPVRLPHQSLGALFVGRDDFMQELRQSLQRHGGGAGNHGTAIVSAVHGLGGVGKTRVAVEYAWQHRTDHSALLAVSAENPQRLQEEVAALCGPRVLNLPEQNTPEQEKRFAAALDWLHQHPGWFLLLDNVDTEDAMQAAEDLIAQLHGGQILITSRLSRWPAHVQPLQLGVLKQEHAQQFLLQRSCNGRRRLATDEADASTLAQELGCLALALEQAAAHIQQRRCSLADYLTLWRQHDLQVQAWHDPKVMKYPRSLATTWFTTLDQLGPGEHALLRLLCWYAPEPVPLWLFEGDKAEGIFVQARDLAFSPEESALAAEGSLRDALLRLADYSMITWDTNPQTVQMHRVVQEILRTRLPQEAKKPSLHHSLQMLLANYPGTPEDVRTWEKWTALQPHIEHAAPLGEAAAIPDPSSTLMSNLAILLNTKAQHPQAEGWFRRALTIDEASFGRDHPTVAIRINNLAELLRVTNRLEEAEPLMHRALSIDEASFGPDHPNVAIDLNNLASLLQDTNRLEEAEPLMRRALNIDEASFGPDHPKVAIRFNNLAQLLQATNRLEEAEPLMRRAWKIDEASFGPDHPSVAIRLNNLGLLFQATNRLEKAEPLMRRAWKIDEASFGPDHPTLAIRLNNLAQLLKATNRLEEAEPLMRRALTIDEASYGPSHPNVARDLNNLAQLLQATNRLEEAEPLMRRHLVIFLRFLQRTGHARPRLEAAKENYRILLREMDLSEAQVEEKLESLQLEVEAGYETRR